MLEAHVEEARKRMIQLELLKQVCLFIFFSLAHLTTWWAVGANPSPLCIRPFIETTSPSEPLVGSWLGLTWVSLWWSCTKRVKKILFYAEFWLLRQQKWKTLKVLLKNHKAIVALFFFPFISVISKHHPDLVSIFHFKYIILTLFRADIWQYIEVKDYYF